MRFSEQTIFRVLLGLAVLINFSGLFLPVIGPDGSLYAALAKNMVVSHNYTDLFAYGKDWLDKPHFPFWMTALSFRIFGINEWSYKLPAILFMLMAARYTWLFAKALYSETIANWSVLILLTAQHIVLSNTDVRAEPYLTGLIIASVYHFYRAYTNKLFGQLFLGSLFAACAVMTKGIFALIPIGAAIGGHLLITKQWKAIFNIRWLIAGVLILLMIIPELYTLYVQFDSHPEKIVFGKTGVSGIKFFFWDSQFGRFFNTGPITGKGSPGFFIHTTLWAFLPWSVILYLAIFQLIRKGIRNEKVTEWYTLCGSLVTFLLFSLSKFQLPHYLNIVFPFFAIISAQYLFSLKNERTIRIIGNIQQGLTLLLMAAIIPLYYFFRPSTGKFWVLLVVLLMVLLLAMIFGRKWTDAKNKIIALGVVTIVMLNIFLNGIFYPELLKYQGGTWAAKFCNSHYPDVPVVQLGTRSNYPLEFDLRARLITIPAIGDTAGLAKPYILVLAGGR